MSIKVKKLSTTNNRLCVRIGYQEETWADDLDKVKALAAKHGYSTQEIASMKIVFPDDPNIVNGGEPSARGVQFEIRPYSMVWVDPQAEELKGKHGKPYFRARGKLIESELGTTPVDMLEVVNSVSEPVFYSLDDTEA